MNNKQKSDIITLIVLFGFNFAVIYNYVQIWFFELGFPYNTFLFEPWRIFGDFLDVVLKWYQYLPADPASNRSYFPFVYLIVNIFRNIQPVEDSLLLFLLIFIVFFAFFCGYMIKSEFNWIDTIKYTLIFTGMSFPVLFALDRANFETFVFIFLGLFYISYEKKHFFLSSVFLSMAIAMKLFPAVFLILYLTEKRYKEIIFSCMMAVGLSLISILFLDGGFFENIERMLLNLSLFTQDYTIQDAGLNYGNSLFGIIKLGIKFLNKYISFQYDLNLILKIYTVVIIGVFTFISLYLIFVEKSLWKKITILIFTMNIFPFVSADYKLVHIFIPLLLFITTKEKSEKWDWMYTFIFGFLLIPKNYPIDEQSLYLGVIFDPLLMGLMMFLIIYLGMKEFLKEKPWKQAESIKIYIKNHFF